MATITTVQVKSGTGTGTTPTATFTSSPTAGNLLVAFVASQAGTTITENSGTWTAGTSIAIAGGTKTAGRLFWKIAGAGESSSPAFTCGSAAWAVALAEYSSSTGWQATPKDIENAQANATGTYTTPSVTPTGAQQELVVCGIWNTSTTGAWSNEAISGSNVGSVTEELDFIAPLTVLFDAVVSTVTGSYQGSSNQSGTGKPGSGHIAFFKPVTGTTTTRDTANRFRLMAGAVRDTVNRFRLQSPPAYRDTVSRFRLQGQGYRLTVNRYALQATGSRDTANRYKLQGAVTRDTVNRFNITAGLFRDTVNRYALRSPIVYRDTDNRFRLQSPIARRDTNNRFALRATAYRDTVNRARLSSVGSRDTVNRARVAGPSTRDTVNRFNLSAPVTGRFRMILGVGL